jgi:hypothetical protein
MLEILDRTINEPSTAPSAPTKGTGPPKEMPPIERYLRPPWPRRARIAVAALSVVAVAGVLGTTLQAVGDDGTDELDAQIVQLTEQRDALADANATLETDLTGATVRLAAVDLEMTAVEAELEAAESRISTLSGDVIEMRIANDSLAADLAATEIALADQVAATEATLAERDALAALFPLTVDTTLRGQDLVGTYDVEWLPAYNSGLADIALPTVRQLTISRTGEGWLRVDIPGVVRAELMRTDGALFTMVDSTTAVPAVNGVQRVARVAITVYAGDTTTTVGGATTVDELGLSIAISTDDVGTVPGGIALYGAELTPQR